MITPGMQAALNAADADGWISPPVYNSLNPASYPFTTADLNRLTDLGLVGPKRQRIDGMFERRLRR